MRITPAVKERPERSGRFGLHIRQDVRVDLQRHRHLRVTQPFADDVDGRARLRQQRRAGVP